MPALRVVLLQGRHAQAGWRRLRRRGRRIPAEGAVASTDAVAQADPEEQLAALGGPTAEARP